jgi:hypothetical protein
MDELIINGTKVDMGDSGVYLEYKSNIMGDISKIESGFSYTIKLPKTAHNMRVFEVVKATTESDVPYRKHEAMLLRDGLPIIRKANVTLRNMSSDSIEIILSFGAGVGVKNLLNDDRTLDKLDFDEAFRDDYVRWTRDLSFECQVADYGFKEDDLNAWYHPTIDVRWVIDRIAETYGIEIDYSQVGDRLDMRMPLLRRNGIKSESRSANITGSTTLGYYDFNHVIYEGSYLEKIILNNEIFESGYINTKYMLSGDVTITLTNNTTTASSLYLVNFEPKGSDWQVRQVLMEIHPYEVKTVNGVTTARYNFSELESEYTGIKGKVGMCFLPYGDVSGVIVASYENKVNTYETGSDLMDNREGYFYIVPNLPEVKVVDFLKGICAVAGAYATVEGKTITLRSRDSIVNGVQEWKHKKIEDVGLSFSVSDVAQKNVFKYKDGEAFSGSFNVNDETLPWSATLIELPFSEVKVAYSGNLYFPLYSYDNEGKQTFSEDKGAYICTSLEDARAYYLTVDGLRWSQLLDKHYQTYIKMVSKAKVKTCKYRLSPLDLMELDMNKCVYDDGALWAIQTIKTKSGDVCDVELIKV